MQQLQSDDLFIPALYTKLPPQAGTGQDESQADDFLLGIKGWAEFIPLDECVE